MAPSLPQATLAHEEPTPITEQHLEHAIDEMFAAPEDRAGDASSEKPGGQG